MTLHEAYTKAKDKAKRKGRVLFTSCRDYGAFWGFMFMPPTYDPNDRLTWVSGEADITVNKNTGAIGEFVPIMDLDLFDKAVSIPVELFTEYNVAV